MKKRSYLLILMGALVGMLLFAAMLAVPAGLAAPSGKRDPGGAIYQSPGDFFVHVATSDTIQAAVTYVDHPVLNENPDAVFLATQLYNPSGEGGLHNDHEIGVFYSNGDQKWAIYNEDQTMMEEGLTFNVYVPQSSPNTFVHTSSAVNINFNYTYLDHSDANGNLNALVFTIHNYNSGGAAGEYHNHHLGVWYTGASRWAIFNQDAAIMLANRDFNVLIPTPGPRVVTHTATVTNTSGNSTLLDHPLLNGNSRAIMIVTQNWNPGGQGAIYNDKTIGVWYSVAASRWTIFNQDISEMPEGAAFNVLISPGNTYLPAIISD